MKKLVLTAFGALALSVSLFAQDISSEAWRKMSKKERKEYKLKTALLEQEKTMELLNSREWVLEANQVQDRYGKTYNIESTLNFVGVDNENSTVQLGSSSNIGYNGVGGITLVGRVANYDLTENDKAGTGAFLKIQVSGASAGHISISMSISPNGSARATVTNARGGRLTYIGQIVSLADSRVYKGQTNF